MPNHDKLSATKVAKVRTPGRYGDGLGLWLQVTHWKTKSNKTNVNKSWLFQYTALNGKVRQLGLGALHTLSLAEARQRAPAARQLVLDGVDPIDARRAQRESAAPTGTGQARHLPTMCRPVHCQPSECLAQRQASRAVDRDATHLRESGHRRPGGGRNRHRPGAEGVATDLGGEDRNCGAGAGLHRVHSRLGQVRGHRQGENPARWRGHLDKLLPAPTKIRQIEHHPALPYTELPEFMIELRRREGLGARALEFTILTAARTNEVIGAKWDEIDFATKVWTVPAARMKAGREHRVPLSDRALAILQSLPREHGSEFVFIGTKEVPRCRVWRCCKRCERCAPGR